MFEILGYRGIGLKDVSCVGFRGPREGGACDLLRETGDRLYVGGERRSCRSTCSCQVLCGF